MINDITDFLNLKDSNIEIKSISTHNNVKEMKRSETVTKEKAHNHNSYRLILHGVFTP